jgi:hypothetical protein
MPAFTNVGLDALRRLYSLAACLGAASILVAAIDTSVVAERRFPLLAPEPSSHETPATPQTSRGAGAVLWREPEDIGSRDLFYGPGGEGHQPRGVVFAFIKEDLAGSNPKFVVRDDTGTKWRIKLGPEARPETVATRLVWAVGYAADEDYFLPEVQVKGMPRDVLHRGRKLIGPDGAMRDVRLKREVADEETLDDWQWRNSPFNGTRELNGLRVLMAVINNWDLKDVNNAIRARTDRDGAVADESVYEVKDLGASFGSTGLELTHAQSEGNLERYARSPFIQKVTPAYVDFAVPRRAAWIVLANPREFFMRLGLRWIGRHIPRQDAKWMGQMLARLSRQQIRDTFRAAAYSEPDIDRFSTILRSRIDQLNEL